MAVISGVNTATPQYLNVYVDHLHRPIQMRNTSGAVVWEATYEPWGAAHSITGAETLDYRFPGQWFQLEAGLHYNWHRHYDPSLGRYTQPDPLGFVDGPGVYAYARNSPLRRIDKDGRLSGGETLTKAAGAVCGPCKAISIGAGIAIAVYNYCTSDDNDDNDDDVEEADDDDDNDCKHRMSDYEIKQCRINPHELKHQELGRKESIRLYELCKCRSGEVAVRLKGCKGPIVRTGVMCP